MSSPAASVDDRPLDEMVCWEHGVYDAHCHPTDTMPTTAAIPSMRAAALTIMATRFDDQSLVAQLAETFGPPSGSAPGTADSSSSCGKVIPSFGYHPWFSYLLWDDGDQQLRQLQDSESLKQRHYCSVLHPQPDESFVALLPDPTPLSRVLDGMREMLSKFPYALVGEIGLDKLFRIKWPPAFTGDRNGSSLSPYRVSLEHQTVVFKAQLALAGEFGRAVSVHGVQCHGYLFDVFRSLWAGHETPVESNKQRKLRRRRDKKGTGYEMLPDMDESASESDDDEKSVTPHTQARTEDSTPKRFPPRICLHSFSADSNILRQWVSKPSPGKRYPSEVFYSFSSTINAREVKGHLSKIEKTIREVPTDRVLVESDLHTAAGIDSALAEAVKLVCAIKGWEAADCAKQLGANWQRFVFGENQ